MVVAKEDKDFICFLWWPEGDFSGKAAEDNKWDLSADTVEAVKCNFYVDSCLMSLGSEE